LATNRENTSRYKTVEGLRRGLSILRALNNLPSGASPTELADLTGLHRTTVRRLLETLKAEACVVYNPGSEQYELAPGCRDLSEGYRDEHWVSSLAAPVMMEMLNDIPWPADLTTLDGDAMIIRESTHRYSRLSFHRAMVGRRLPLTVTASGRAQLAWCSAAERTDLLSLAVSREMKPGSNQHKVSRSLEALLRKIRRLGYSWNAGQWREQSRFSAIAVPVLTVDARGEERLQGVLSTVFPSNAMTPEIAAQRHLAGLSACARKIGQLVGENAAHADVLAK